MTLSARILEHAEGLCGHFSTRHIVPAYAGQPMEAMGVLLAPDRLPDKLGLMLVTLEIGHFLIWPGQDGVVFNDDGVSLAASTGFCGTVGLPRPEWVRANATELDHEVVIGVDSVWRNWYHHMILGLPRTRIGQMAVPHATVVMPDYDHHAALGWPIGFPRATWEATLGIFNRRPLLLPSGCYRASRVHYVMITNKEPAYLPCLAHFRPAHAFLFPAGPRDRASPRRILIRRTDTERLNTEEAALVEDIAGKRGFVPVSLEGMSLHEQVQLFRGATHVIGAHGAGLSNLVFASPECRVLEINRPLIGEKWLRPWFWLIARSRNMQYSFLDASLGMTRERVNEAVEGFHIWTPSESDSPTGKLARARYKRKREER